MRTLDLLNRAEVPSQRSAFSAALWKVEVVLAHARLRQVDSSLPHRLNLGCGTIFADGWTNADFATLRWAVVQRTRRPDWNMDASRRWKCDDRLFAAIHCEHVLEHFPYQTSVGVLRECFRTLQPGGTLRIVLPDLGKFVKYYLDGSGPDEFVHLGPGPVALSKLTQCDRHMSIWDSTIIIDVLQELGFVDVTECEPRQTRLDVPAIDSPERFWESLYVEASKPSE